MKANEGTVDRLVRVVAGLALAFGGFTGVGGGALSGTLGTILGVVGLVFLVTGLVGYCPLYTMLGISTCPVKGSRAR